MFLGHQVSAKGIEADDSKIKAVKEFPTPTSDQQLRQFLGLASYLRRFVKGFASIAGPLHAILGGTGRKGRKRPKPKDDRKFSEKWNIQCEQAFINLKEALSSPPILAYPDYKLPFILEVDASIDGFGAILLQKQSNRTVVIAYASRKLRDAEKTDELVQLNEAGISSITLGNHQKVQRLSVWFSIYNIDRQQPIKSNSYL